MSSDIPDESMESLLAHGKDKLLQLFKGEGSLEVVCKCGEVWSQHTATVCPKCFRWPDALKGGRDDTRV